jgi:aminopeptidase N
MHVFYCRRAGDLLAESSWVAPQQKRRAYALADAKPHFAPDRPCDIVHTALTLQLDLAQQSLRGTCATTVRAVQEAVSDLTLDAVDLQIAHVRQTGGATLTYDYDGQRLRVTFPEPLQRGATTTIEVDYGVTKPRLGLYFITPDAAYPHKPVQVWSQCQDEDARYWFPCFDAPNEKATTAMTVTVSQPYFALSNGKLLATTRDEGASTITYHWLQDQRRFAARGVSRPGQVARREHHALAARFHRVWPTPAGTLRGDSRLGETGWRKGSCSYPRLSRR